MKGYATALFASITVASSISQFAQMMIKGVSGKRALMLNCVVGTCAGSAAGFTNTYYMRAPEREKGIDVFSD